MSIRTGTNSQEEWSTVNIFLCSSKIWINLPSWRSTRLVSENNSCQTNLLWGDTVGRQLNSSVPPGWCHILYSVPGMAALLTAFLTTFSTGTKKMAALAVVAPENERAGDWRRAPILVWWPGVHWGTLPSTCVGVRIEIEFRFHWKNRHELEPFGGPWRPFVSYLLSSLFMVGESYLKLNETRSHSARR